MRAELERVLQIDQLHELLDGGKKLDAIFILGGGIPRKRGSNGYVSFTSASYALQPGLNKPSGTKARVIAAAELATRLPQTTVVTMSHLPKMSRMVTDYAALPVELPSYAQIMAEDLKRSGVEPDRIRCCDVSTSTTTELLELIQMTVAEEWREVAVVTSEYHLARVRAIIGKLLDADSLTELHKLLTRSIASPDEQNLLNNFWQDFTQAVDAFNTNQTRLYLIPAEAILGSRHRLYRQIFQSVFASQPYKDRIASEQQGLSDLEIGRYQFGGQAFVEYLRWVQKRK